MPVHAFDPLMGCCVLSHKFTVNIYIKIICIFFMVLHAVFMVGCAERMKISNSNLECDLCQCCLKKIATDILFDYKVPLRDSINPEFSSAAANNQISNYVKANNINNDSAIKSLLGVIYEIDLREILNDETLTINIKNSDYVIIYFNSYAYRHPRYIYGQSYFNYLDSKKVELLDSLNGLIQQGR